MKIECLQNSWKGIFTDNLSLSENFFFLKNCEFLVFNRMKVLSSHYLSNFGVI